MRRYLLAGIAAAGLLMGPAAAGPPLAPGVEAAPDFKPTSARYVVTNGGPLYRAPRYAPDQTTGRTLRSGEHPEILGEANAGLYLLVGENGRGIGYVSRSLLCPADLCRGDEG